MRRRKNLKYPAPSKIIKFIANVFRQCFCLSKFFSVIQPLFTPFHPIKTCQYFLYKFYSPTEILLHSFPKRVIHFSSNNLSFWILIIFWNIKWFLSTGKPSTFYKRLFTLPVLQLKFYVKYTYKYYTKSSGFWMESINKISWNINIVIIVTEGPRLKTLPNSIL